MISGSVAEGQLEGLADRLPKVKMP
jgi:hypothetical protein